MTRPRSTTQQRPEAQRQSTTPRRLVGSNHMLWPVFQLLGAVGERRGLFARSTLSMTAYQLTAGAASALSAAIAALVVAGNSDRSMLALLFVALAAAIIGHGAFMWIESWLSHVLAYRVIDSLRLQVHDAIERITPGGLKKRRAGEVAGSTMSDVESLEWFYAHTLGAALNAVAGPVLMGIALVWMTGPVGLIVPAGVALLLAIPWAMGPLQARQGADVRRELGHLKAISLEGTEGLRELLSLGLSGHHRQRVLDATGRVQHRKRAFALRAGAETAMADVVLAVTTLSFLVLLAQRVEAGQLSPVIFPAAMVLLGASFAPAAGAFVMFQKLGEVSAAARRVLDVLHAEPDVPEPATPARTANQPHHDGPGALRFENVRFAYDSHAPVLSDVSFDIEAGSTVAIVGASGAGKTTIAHLLVRFWDPAAGVISLDGVALTDLSPHKVRTHITLVSQSPYIFRGSVRDNLRLAAPEASAEQMWQALDDAQLGATVRAWEQGLDQPIGENATTLSGGQKQRLAIAQAFLREPRVLVLDEAAAHLDATHEQDLADAVARVRRDLTTVIIAHRASTIRRCDRIVVLDEGTVLAVGSHNELIATCDEYRSLLAADAEPAPLQATVPK